MDHKKHLPYFLLFFIIAFCSYFIIKTIHRPRPVTTLKPIVQTTTPTPELKPYYETLSTTSPFYYPEWQIQFDYPDDTHLVQLQPGCPGPVFTPWCKELVVASKAVQDCVMRNENNCPIEDWTDIVWIEVLPGASLSIGGPVDPDLVEKPITKSDGTKGLQTYDSWDGGSWTWVFPNKAGDKVVQFYSQKDPAKDPQALKLINSFKFLD